LKYKNKQSSKKNENQRNFLLLKLKIKFFNHLGGGPVVRAWDQEVCSVVSGLSLMVAHMMTTGGLHGR